MPLSYNGIMTVNTNEYFEIDRVTAYNINIATYTQSIKDSISYMRERAAVLNFDIFSETGGIPTYTVNALTVYNAFSKESTAVRITPLNTNTNSQSINITFSGLNITNTTTESKGCFYVNAEAHVSISDSYFTYNKANNFAKDFYVSSFLSLKITSTVFLGDADVDRYTQFILLTGATTAVPVFDTVTVKCNQAEDADFNQTEYEKMLDTGNRDGVKSPILLESSQLLTRNCVFKNCRNSGRGAVLSLNYDSTYQDDGSTFAYNLADTGGAINVEKSKITLHNTTLFENYAIDSGAVHLASESFGVNWANVTFRSNYALNEGGAVSVLSSSNLAVSFSTFELNRAKMTSVIYALGTFENNIISNCVFENNTSEQSKTLSFAFANLLMSDCQFSNNIVYLQTAGIFMTFSKVIITGTKFENSKYSDFNTRIEIADSTRLTGGFIYISVDVILTIDSCTFTTGYAFQGGAIYVSGTSSVTVSNSIFTNNFASSKGGDIYLANYLEASLINNTFTYSASYSEGLSVYSSSGILSMSNNTITIYKPTEHQQIDW